MIPMDADRRSAHAVSPETHDGNRVDVHYLLHARAALVPMLAVSRVAAQQAASHHVRALARVALSEQVDALAAITACLAGWGHDAELTSATDGDELAQLRGAELDRAFVGLLVRHAETSLTRARVEMVGGASRVARPIAEATIHEQDRRLAALAVLSRTVFPEAPVAEDGA